MGDDLYKPLTLYDGLITTGRDMSTDKNYILRYLPASLWFVKKEVNINFKYFMKKMKFDPTGSHIICLFIGFPYKIN